MTFDTQSMIEQAFRRFDEMNSRDPKQIEVDGTRRPRELSLALSLYSWVKRVQPQAGPALLLASRCQHLMRFSMPRSEYPEGRVGYLKWRKELSRKHADLATKELFDVGFDQAVIDQVRKINLKQELKTDPDCQAMEDALCLSFLEQEYPVFCDKHGDEKVIDIVRKTWRKMSERGHKLALELPLEGRAKDLVEKALSA